MRGVFTLAIFLLASTVVSADDSRRGSLRVIRQKLSPPLETNCYLVYDENSGEAALVDVGGPIDTLISSISAHNLKMKYLLITHCHPDHVFGLPAARKLFPDAKICASRADYDDAKLYALWESKLSPEEVASIKAIPDVIETMNFDISKVCTPDIFLDDNQILKLGDLEIRSILAPGHSRGSICFYADKALFSGDVLFRRSVGRSDLEGMSWESLLESVQGLYSLLPDETVVYPGHGEFTNIGEEKMHNPKIPQAKEPMKITGADISPAVWGVPELPGTPGPHAGVIILEGSSGWRPTYAQIARAFADSGFVALAVDYFGEAGPDTSDEDVLRKWPIWQATIRNAAAYLRDSTSVSDCSIGLVGYSRGASLAVSIASSMPQVKAVVDYFGGGGAGGGSIDQETRHFPPLLILHGDSDSSVPVDRAYRLRDAVLANGGQVEMKIYAGAQHAFNAPWSPAYSEPETIDSWKRTIDFLRRHLEK